VLQHVGQTARCFCSVLVVICWLLNVKRLLLYWCVSCSARQGLAVSCSAVLHVRYTGEDGFELSIPNTHMLQLAEALVADPEVRQSVAYFP
jgi:hypothetical protein